MLEPAIAPHLRTERTIPSKLPKDYTPPFSAYAARFPEKTKDIVMAIFGAQSRPSTPLPSNVLDPILNFITSKSANEPGFHDCAKVTDTSSCSNHVVIAYWNDRTQFEAWSKESGFDSWWVDLDPTTVPHGWFKEVFLPPIERFETVFSHDGYPEGAAHMKQSMSGPVAEHVYWGSMRDRLPLSQTDEMNGEKWQPETNGSAAANGTTNGTTHASTTSEDDTTTQRVCVPGRKNTALIRSGQDWSSTLPKERTLYLDTMHPVLIKGMNFLRDEGEKVGCYSCRFMSVFDPASPETETDKTFGLAFFDELKSLEDWSKQHKTHLDIFGGFMKYAAELKGDISLRLFHEVLVLDAEQQILEYVGCHARTGFLVGR